MPAIPENNPNPDTGATSPENNPGPNAGATPPVNNPDPDAEATSGENNPDANAGATSPVNNPTTDTGATSPVNNPDPNAGVTAAVNNPDPNTGATSPVNNPDSSMPATVLKDAPITVVEAQDATAVKEIPLAPIQKAGYNLSRFILFIICGCLLLLFGLLIFKSFDASNEIKLPNSPMSDSTFNQQKELIAALQAEKKNFRDFFMQFAQMILLNLLLPTLTAVLGYIFGSRESGKPSDNS